MKRVFLVFISLCLCFISSCKEEDLSKILSVVYNGKAVTVEGVSLEAQSGAFIELKLKNTSEKHAISFTKISSDRPENLKIQNSPKVLNASSEAAFKVLYEGTPASFDSNITIEYKVGTSFSSVLTISVKVIGLTEESEQFLELVEPAEALLDFGTVTSGTVSKALTVAVRNVTGSSFRVSSIVINGTDAAAFRMEDSSLSEIGLDFPAGETREFSIVFAPSEVGEYSDAAFSVLWDKGSIDVLLKGTAREPEPEEIILSVLKDDVILTNGSIFSFGEVFLDASPAPVVTFTLKNGSPIKPLNVASVEFEPSDGLTVSRSSFTVAAAGSETLTVTFHPVATGAFESEMTIRSDATEPENGVFTLKLTATVIEPIPLMQLSGEGLSEDPSGNGNYVLTMPDTVFEPQAVEVFREILISNNGTALLRIDSVTVPEGVGLSSDFAGAISIAPGESAVLKLTFTPVSEEDLDAVISLVGNDKGSKAETLIAVTGKIGSDLPLLPPSLTLFPVVELNSEKYYISGETLSLTIATASGSKGTGLFSYSFYEGTEAVGASLKQGEIRVAENESNAVIVLSDVVSDGKQYTVFVTDSDKDGAVSQAASVCFYVDKTVPGKPESVLPDSSIEIVNRDGLNVTAAENLIWNWTVPAKETGKPNNNILRSEYRILDGATLVPESEEWIPVLGAQTEPICVEDGKSYAAEVRFIDEFNRPSDSTVSQPVMIDRSVPAVPANLTLKAGIDFQQSDDTLMTAEKALTWIWDASDKANFYLWRINEGVWTKTELCETDVFTVTEDGLYTAEVKAVNDLGFESASTVCKVEVSTERPAAPVDLRLKDSILSVPVENGVRTAATDLVWIWTADPDITYRYRINNDPNWTDIVDSEVSFTVENDGSYTIEVKSVNDLGVESLSAMHTVTVDTAKPQTVLENVMVTVADGQHCEQESSVWYVDDAQAVVGWTGTDGWTYRYMLNSDEMLDASVNGTAFATSALGMADDGSYTVSVYAVNDLGTVSDAPQTVNIQLVTRAPQLNIENGINLKIEVDVWNDIRDKWNGTEGLLSQLVFKVSSDGTGWETVALNTPSSDKTTVTMDDAALLKALNKPGADKSVYDYDNRYANVNTKTVTFTATGRFGKTTAQSITVFLKDTTAPVITNPNLGTFAFGSQDNFTITIRDNSGKYDGTAQSYALTYGGYKACYVAGTMKIPFTDASGNIAEVTLTVNAPATGNMVGNGNFSDITNTDTISDSNTTGLTFGSPSGWTFNSQHSHFAYGGDGGSITGIAYYYTPSGIGKKPMLVCGAITNGTKYGYMTLSRWSSFNNTNVEIYTTETNTAASKTLYEGVEYELSYKYKDYTISSGVSTFTNGATVSVSTIGGAGKFNSATSFAITRTPQASGTAYVKDALNTTFSSQSGRVKVTGGNISGFTVTYVYGNTEGIRYTENYCGSIITDVSFEAVDWPKVQTDGSVAY